MGLAHYVAYSTSPSSIHVLSYGILAGTTVWHSFLGGPIAYKTLPRQQFGTLQGKLFPPFFTLQAITSSVCLATSYYNLSGTYNELIVLGVSAVSALLNLLLIGPWTTAIMNDRHKLERATNTKYTDEVLSDAMTSLNTSFNVAHSVSSIVNLVTFGSIVAHAIHLGRKIHLYEVRRS